MAYEVMLGSCVDLLPQIPSQSIDAVITDPPYPEIDRDYGRLTEDEWWALMMGVGSEVRRILKPTGSAVFILQPNSRRVGSMRGWLWEFMAWVCRDWNMVQDAWWWNHVTMPTVHSTKYGLMRGSLKACVWAGPTDCYRNQTAVMWAESEEMTAQRLSGRSDNGKFPSGHSIQRKRALDAAERNGGVTPFNVIPVPNTSRNNGHGAATPLRLADWWTRYIVPPGGIVLDPFNGTGTMGVAALQNGCGYIGMDILTRNVEYTNSRLSQATYQMELICGQLADDDEMTPMFDDVQLALVAEYVDARLDDPYNDKLSFAAWLNSRI